MKNCSSRPDPERNNEQMKKDKIGMQVIDLTSPLDSTLGSNTINEASRKKNKMIKNLQLQNKLKRNIPRSLHHQNDTKIIKIDEEELKSTSSSSIGKRRRTRSKQVLNSIVPYEIIEIDDSTSTPDSKKLNLSSIVTNNSQFGGLFQHLQESNMECQCCFMEYDIEEMCHCEDGHLFCKTCLRKYAEEEIFGKQKNILRCMWSDSVTNQSCSYGFCQSQLDLALPKKVKEKYDEARFLEDLQHANISNLCKCPKCHYQAILPETEHTFYCPRPECGFRSCRYCGEQSHYPLACNEVEKANDTNGRKLVEEAMTNARIRECPNCKKRFFKLQGCNKMTCSCGTHICYICRAKITNGYAHFCNKPNCNHKRCGKCPMHSDALKQDMKAVKQAGANEIEKVTKKDQSDLLKKNVSILIKDVSGK